MSGAPQDLFERAEAIAEALNHMAGCEDALVFLLQDVLERQPGTERRVYSVIEAMGQFRAAAERQAEDLAHTARVQ